MKMGKICFLLDPDKSEIRNVFEACVRLQSAFDKKFLKNLVEYWVGGTKAGGTDVKKWLMELENKKIGKRVVYPGKISQGILGYQHSDYAVVPYLLNWSDFKIFIYNLVGIMISKLYKRRQLFGYLVMTNKSSVGKRIGARNLSNNEAISIVNEFLGKGISKVVYLEAGSGAKKPVDIDLIKKISQIMSNYSSSCLIVGGGLKNANEVKALFSVGVDKVVIGTALEQNSAEKSLAVMKNIIKPFEIVWKKHNLIVE